MIVCLIVPAVIGIAFVMLDRALGSRAEPMELWINRGNYPRWLHMLYAHTHSNFWLPCRLCGKKHGGHEPTQNNTFCMDCEVRISGGRERTKQCGPKACYNCGGTNILTRRLGKYRKRICQRCACSVTLLA